MRRRRKKNNAVKKWEQKPSTENCKIALDELYGNTVERFGELYGNIVERFGIEKEIEIEPETPAENGKEDEHMNYVELIGNLTRDPMVRYTKTGTPVATFCVAVNRKYVDKYGQEQTLADFVNVVAWDRLASAVGAQVHKGDRVHVVGRLTSRSYDDKDGKKVYVTEVNASTVSRPLDIRTEQSNAYYAPQTNYGTNYNAPAVGYGGGGQPNNGNYGGGHPNNGYNGEQPNNGYVGADGFQKFGRPVQNGTQSAPQGTQAEQEEIPF